MMRRHSSVYSRFLSLVSLLVRFSLTHYLYEYLMKGARTRIFRLMDSWRIQNEYIDECMYTYSKSDART